MNTSREDHRVLVVEEPNGRETLKLGLELAGYQVDLAQDGETGLLVAAARTPAAALIDLNVQIVDGWRLAASLREVFDEEMGLIAMADQNEPEELSLAAGFDVHLVKPVSADRARHTLRRLLAH